MNERERFFKSSLKETALETCPFLGSFTNRRLMLRNHPAWSVRVNNEAGKIRKAIKGHVEGWANLVKIGSETSLLNDCLTTRTTYMEGADYYEKILILGYEVGSMDVAQFFVGDIMQIIHDHLLWNNNKDESKRAEAVVSILGTGVAMKRNAPPIKEYKMDDLDFRPSGQEIVPDVFDRELPDIEI